MTTRRIHVVNRTRSTDLGERIAVADSRWRRLRGMLGRPEPAAGEGLLLDPCRGVHMFGMRYALDILFLDPSGRVDALYPGLEPWSRSGVHREARYALEVPVGTIERTQTRAGDQLEWKAIA